MALALPAPASADHVLAETWGTTGAGAGQLATPTGMDTDAYDNVYVADYDNNRVQKFSPDGELLGSWGSGGTADGQFNGPKDVAVDSADERVYVADEKNHRIQKFTLGGAHVATFGGTAAGSGDAQFDHPYGVAVEGGYLYVADHDNNRIQRLTTAGAYDTQWGGAGNGDGQFNGPSGVAVTAGGTVYVTDYVNDRVQFFSSTGNYQGQWGSSGSGNTQFNAPTAVEASSVGVFVVDESNGRVTQFDATGGYLAKWESLTAPQGIAAGTLNRFFVTDLENRVLRFDGPVNGSVVRTSGTRLIFEADSGDANDVEVTRVDSDTFTATDLPGNSLTGGGGCAGTVGSTITCDFPAGTTVSTIRVSTKDQADSIEIVGSTPGVLDGGSGNDTLNGGDSSSDVVSYAAVSGSGVTVDLSDSGPQDTGGAGTDTILDVEGVTGSPQNDTFAGTAGANAFSGGAGTDTVSYQNASGPAGVTVDLGAGTATGGDTLSGIENVTGSQFADTITGGPGVNVLVCLGGTDTVSAELADTVAADCENVTRVDGSGGGDTGGGTGGGGSGGGTPAPGPGTTTPSAPVLSGLAVKSMRTGKRGTFTYSLDKAATTTITLARVQKGRKVGRTCKKQTRKNRKKRSCTMFVTVGKLTASGAAGRNTLAFSGKLGGRKLAPGIYRATAVATNSGGASKPVAAQFVVRR
jgi:DNA-binding beta-propeller fold protein YncE